MKTIIKQIKVGTYNSDEEVANEILKVLKKTKLKLNNNVYRIIKVGNGEKSAIQYLLKTSTFHKSEDSKLFNLGDNFFWNFEIDSLTHYIDTTYIKDYKYSYFVAYNKNFLTAGNDKFKNSDNKLEAVSIIIEIIMDDL